MSFINMFGRSANELKNVRCLAVTGVLSSLYIVLNAYVALNIGAPLRITFGFLALAIIGMLYGPVVAVIAAIPCDLLAATLDPHNAMNPIFTPNRALEALIYGLLLYGLLNVSYKDSVKQKAIFILKMTAARLIVIIICYFFVNNFLIFTFLLPAETTQRILSEGTFFAWAWARNGIKNIVQFPVDLSLMYIMLPAAGIAYTRTIRRVT
ncbi:MAG: folate family ECF transporter S component [Oscillospiraceae bacterium]|nr:folate family ECF transporter S component [Oscillospiraceae bacterium]